MANLPAILLIVIISANAFMLIELLDRRASERAAIREFNRANLYRVQRAAHYRRMADQDDAIAAHRAAQGCNSIAAYHRSSAATYRARAAQLEA